MYSYMDTDANDHMQQWLTLYMYVCDNYICIYIEIGLVTNKLASIYNVTALSRYRLLLVVPFMQPLLIISVNAAQQLLSIFQDKSLSQPVLIVQCL